MKYIAILSLFVLAFLPFSAQAHGGVEKSAGSVVVYLTQEPLSPMVGEKVAMTFVFEDKMSGAKIENLSAELKLIDTVHDNPSQDKVILTKQVQTDANAAISFEYTFDKPNYFDVELSFSDPKTKEQEEVGFLVQTRDGSAADAADHHAGEHENKTAKSFSINTLVITLGAGIIAGWAIANYRKTDKQ